MTGQTREKDLIVLVADKNMASAVEGLLSRPKALGISAIQSDIYTHPERDPGCLRKSADFLKPFTSGYAHALVLLDRDGCGRDQLSRRELEQQVETQLDSGGWGDRAAAIVIDPELEAWVWSDSPEVSSILGWGDDRTPDLRTWLHEHDFLREGLQKPVKPKEAVERVLRLARKPRSSAIYEALATKVSVRRCIDPAFGKLKETLKAWFSE